MGSREMYTENILGCIFVSLFKSLFIISQQKQCDLFAYFRKMSYLCRE